MLLAVTVFVCCCVVNKPILIFHYCSLFLLTQVGSGSRKHKLIKQLKTSIVTSVMISLYSVAHYQEYLMMHTCFPCALIEQTTCTIGTSTLLKKRYTTQFNQTLTTRCIPLRCDLYTHHICLCILCAFSLYKVYPATSSVLVISNRCGRLFFGYISTLVGLDRAQVAMA